MVRPFFNASLLSEGPLSVIFFDETDSSSKPVGVSIYSDRTVEISYNSDGKLETRRARSCCILTLDTFSLIILGIECDSLVQWKLTCTSFSALQNFNMIGDFLPRRSCHEINTISDLLIQTANGYEQESNLMEFYTDTHIHTDGDGEEIKEAIQIYTENLTKAQSTLLTNIYKLLVEDMEADIAMQDQREQRHNEWLMLRAKIEQAIDPDGQDTGALEPIRLVVPHIEMPDEYTLITSLQEAQDEALDEFISIVNDDGEIDESPTQ